MLLNRNIFFLLLASLFIGPPLIYKITWLARSKKTTGILWFEGHTVEVQGGLSSHPVILFRLGMDSFYFDGPMHLQLRPGEPVPVVYQKDDPADAAIDTPKTIWLYTFVYSFFPVLVLLVLFLTPERFDPLIPKRSKVRLGVRPFIKIISG